MGDSIHIARLHQFVIQVLCKPHKWLLSMPPPLVDGAVSEQHVGGEWIHVYIVRWIESMHDLEIPELCEGQHLVQGAVSRRYAEACAALLVYEYQSVHILHELFDVRLANRLPILN